MGIQLTLAVRYLGGRRLRALLTTLAVVFGVLVIFGMNILVPTMLQAFQSTMMAASDQVDVTVRLKSGDAFTAGLVNQVRSVEGVQSAQALMARPVNLPANFYDHDPATPDRVSVLTLVGLDPEAAQGVRPYAVRDGRFLTAGDTDAAVIAASLAEPLGLSLGSTLSLPTARGLVRLTVVGIRSPRAMPGSEEVLVTLGQAQALLDSPGQATAIEVNLASKDPAHRDAASSAIQELLGGQFTTEALSSAGNMYAALQAANVGFSAFGALALFMGAFIIFNTFRTIVAERRRDIGMLRAIGASRGTVIGVFVVEGLIQGVVGTILGMLLGYLLAWAGTAAVSPLMGQFVHLQLGMPRVTPGIVIISIVVGVGVTLAAGLFPALAAGRVTPMEVLRPSQSGPSLRRSIGARAIAGMVLVLLALVALLSSNTGLLALGVVLFMIGLVLVAPLLVRPLSLVFGAILALFFARQGTGSLAQGNLARQPTRAAVTASTTMIALAIVVALAGMMVSISDGFLSVLRKSLGSDYLFVPPSVGVWQNNVGATTSLAERLRAIDGVERVSTLRFAAAALDAPARTVKGGTSQTVSILGIDPVDYPLVSTLTFNDGSAAQAYAALAEGRSLIVNPILAASIGVRVGDVVPLQTPEGRLEYRVVGIASDFLNAKIATAFISQAAMAKDFHRTEDVFIQLNLRAGADAAAAGAAIKNAAADYPQFSVFEGKAYFKEMSGLFAAIFPALYLLFIFMTLPALISTLNTLAISVIERTREIGVLRAVGTTRGQVQRIVLAESLLLAAFGIAFGLASGLYLGYLLVRTMSGLGFPCFYIFPWQGVTAAVIVGLGVGVLAAIVPARKAARLQIVEALRYE
ncbi:MAG: ABC transporter permease [Spirochaetes bacterium]|nr:ABC transporter permease [Spirochaetota bacterium]